MASTEEQVEKLQELDYFVSKPDQLNQLRLFLYSHESSGVNDEDVEKAEHLLEILDILKQVYPKDTAIRILHYMLKLVGVQECDEKLGASEDNLTACRERKDLAYPSLIVSVCKDLREDDFKQLRSNLCFTVLQCNSANITSRDVLLSKLQCQQKISSKNLNLLIDHLDRIGRKDIASRVGHFVETGKFEHHVDDTGSPSPVPKPLFVLPVQETTHEAGESDVPSNTRTRTDSQSEDLSHPLLDVVSDNGSTGDHRSGERTEALDQSQSSDDAPGNIEHFVNTENTSEQTPAYELCSEAYAQAGAEVNAPARGKSSVSSMESTSSVEEQPSACDRLLINSNERQDDKPDLELKYLSSTLKKQRVALIVLIVPVCSIFALVASIFTGLSIYYATINTPEPVYAAGGETVIAAEVTDEFVLLWNSISECHQSPDDYPHSNQLYIVSNQLQRHSRPKSINYTKLFNQTDAYCGSKSSILPDPLYMLQGSSINFSVCVSANSEPGPDEHGLFVIFDDNKAYKEYTTDGDCLHTDGAAYVHNLNIGSPGHPMCTPVSYKMTTNGHLYALPVIPGGAQYYYQYSFDQFYLNEDDFGDRKCTFSFDGNNVCDIGFVSPAPAYLVVYVVPNSVANSQSTHLCYRSDWSYGLIAMVVLLGVTAGVSLIAVIAFSICLHRACRKYKTTKSQLREHAATHAGIASN